VYDRVVMVPRWLFVAITGVIGTLLIQLFHRDDGSAQKAYDAKRRAEAKRLSEKAEAEATATATTAATATAVKDEKKTATTTPKKRKGGKK
jgi:hypothetical protein